MARAAPVDHRTSKVPRGSAKPGSASSTCAPSAANANAALATRPAISGSTAAKPSSGLNAIRSPATPSSSPAPNERAAGGSCCQSRASGAAITSSISARSATVRAIGPTCETGPNGLAGQAGTRPNVGLRPGSPQNAHGIRIEPPPSVPSASGTIPAASAAELPPLEPPGVMRGSHGLRVTPVSALSVTPFQPSSGVVVLPGSTAPERRSEATTGASSSHGPAGSIAVEPRSVGQPWVTSRSLTPTGTPSSGPAGSPRAQRASDARAPVSAASASTRQNALSSPSRSSIRASAASASSTGERSPAR